MRGHEAVLLNEAIEGLAIKPDGVYIDGTFGRGGHSAAILAKLSDKGRLIAVDKDKEAILHAKSTLCQDKRFSIYHHSFAELEKVAQKNTVDGILLDLGVSSPQLDDAQRGFSFLHEGPLDMRMNQDSTLDAAYFINHADEKELVQVFRDYGEERFALRIARAIIRERQLKPIESTKVLAEIVKEANPKWERHKHPATRVFQAIRIHVNQEIEDLKLALEQAFQLLAPNGRLVVISFHSLEDRIVKQFMRDKEEGEKIPHYLPIPDTNRIKIFKRLSKAIKPSEEELKSNPRARSAVLRIGEKRQ